MPVPDDPPPTPSAIATIGVYGFSASTFVGGCWRRTSRLVLDVRQRRGVRGPQYAWANRGALQDALAEAELGYRHHARARSDDRAAPAPVRRGRRLGVGKRSREELAPAYVERTCARSSTAPTSPLSWRRWRPKAAPRSLCVEADPEACHRSLIAARLAEHHGFTIEHLRP